MSAELDKNIAIKPNVMYSRDALIRRLEHKHLVATCLGDQDKAMEIAWEIDQTRKYPLNTTVIMQVNPETGKEYPELHRPASLGQVS